MIAIFNMMVREKPIGYRAWPEWDNPGERLDWPLDANREVNIIRILGTEMGDACERAHNAKAWAKDHVYNSEGWKNGATGWKVAIGSKGINEAIDRLKWPKKVARQTIAAVPTLIRAAIPIQTEPDRRGRKDIIAVHTLIAPILIGGGIFRARMTIRETKEGHNYYGHHLEGLNIAMPEAFCVGHTPEGELGVTRHPGTLRLGLLLTGFKPHGEDTPAGSGGSAL